MNGVTWDERAETDWLASNGRWYPRSSYPSNWGMSALPPAPDQAQSGSILRRVTAQFNELADLAAVGDEKLSGRAKPAAVTRQRTQVPPRPSKTTRKSSGRASTSGTARAADRSFLPKEPYRHTPATQAEVTAQRTYKPKVGAGPPPPAAIPPPPGRLKDVPATPAQPPPPKSRSARSPKPDSTNPEVLAGDLGSVFGSAKQRITKAINDAAELDK